MKQGFPEGHSEKRDVEYFRKAGEGIPTGRTVLPNPLTGGSSGGAQFGHEQLQLFEQLLATSGCLAGDVVELERIVLWQHSSSRAGTSLEGGGGAGPLIFAVQRCGLFVFLVGAVVEGGVAVLDGVGLLHLEDVGRGFAEILP